MFCTLVIVIGLPLFILLEPFLDHKSALLESSHCWTSFKVWPKWISNFIIQMLFKLTNELRNHSLRALLANIYSKMDKLLCIRLQLRMLAKKESPYKHLLSLKWWIILQKLEFSAFTTFQGKMCSFQANKYLANINICILCNECEHEYSLMKKQRIFVLFIWTLFQGCCRDNRSKLHDLSTSNSFNNDN